MANLEVILATVQDNLTLYGLFVGDTVLTIRVGACKEMGEKYEPLVCILRPVPHPAGWRA